MMIARIIKTRIYLAVLLIVFSNGAVCADENENTADASENKSGNTAQAKKKQQTDTGPIKLESVFVGDKEQPAISYFIPWQGVGAPDNLQWNVEEKHDKALQTVDRQIMLRSIQLYDQLQLEASGD